MPTRDDIHKGFDLLAAEMGGTVDHAEIDRALDSDLTARAREIAAGLDPDERYAMQRVAYAMQFHALKRSPRGSAMHAWACSGSDTPPDRCALETIQGRGRFPALATWSSSDSWTWTELGRAVAAVLAEGTVGK